MPYSNPFLLSTGGSIRATSYAFSNKSVTLNGKTHVVWLDRPAFVRGRVYDHATKTWGPTLALFEGSDNHTSPALIADSFADPHLRIVLGPHGAGWNNGQFMWAITENPGNIETWKWPHSFGYVGTYPAPVHTPQGLDAMVYRGGEWPPSLMFQRQKGIRQWTKAREIFWQDVGPQYTHYGAYLDCDAMGTLYVASHFYTASNLSNLDDPDNHSRGVAILKSTDLGDTWTTLSGERVVTPALYSDRFMVPANGERNMSVGGLSIDSHGTPWVIAFDAGPRIGSIFISRWINGGWETHDAGKFVPKPWMAVDTAFTIDAKDRLHLAITALRPDKLSDNKALTWWGHASCEVFHMVSDNGGKTYSCNQISQSDDTKPSWLPTISKNSLYHRVEKPAILYTHGDPAMITPPGSKTPEEGITEVFCVFVEQ